MVAHQQGQLIGQGGGAWTAIRKSEDPEPREGGLAVGCPDLITGGILSVLSWEHVHQLLLQKYSSGSQRIKYLAICTLKTISGHSIKVGVRVDDNTLISLHPISHRQIRVLFFYQ